MLTAVLLLVVQGLDQKQDFAPRGTFAIEDLQPDVPPTGLHEMAAKGRVQDILRVAETSEVDIEARVSAAVPLDRSSMVVVQ